MQLYAVKLFANHTADPKQVADGYLGYENVNQPILYTRGEAIRKAKVFGGKIEKYGHEYASDERKIIMLKLLQFSITTIGAMGLDKHIMYDTMEFRTKIHRILLNSNTKPDTRVELIVLNELVIRYDGVKFV